MHDLKLLLLLALVSVRVDAKPVPSSALVDLHPRSVHLARRWTEEESSASSPEFENGDPAGFGNAPEGIPPGLHHVRLARRWEEEEEEEEESEFENGSGDKLGFDGLVPQGMGIPQGMGGLPTAPGLGITQAAAGNNPLATQLPAMNPLATMPQLPAMNALGTAPQLPMNTPGTAPPLAMNPTGITPLGPTGGLAGLANPMAMQGPMPNPLATLNASAAIEAEEDEKDEKDEDDDDKKPVMDVLANQPGAGLNLMGQTAMPNGLAQPVGLTQPTQPMEAAQQQPIVDPQAMLQQANQAPNLALNLLRDGAPAAQPIQTQPLTDPNGVPPQTLAGTVPKKPKKGKKKKKKGKKPKDPNKPVDLEKALKAQKKASKKDGTKPKKKKKKKKKKKVKTQAVAVGAYPQPGMTAQSGMPAQPTMMLGQPH